MFGIPLVEPDSRFKANRYLFVNPSDIKNIRDSNTESCVCFVQLYTDEPFTKPLKVGCNATELNQKLESYIYEQDRISRH